MKCKVAGPWQRDKGYAVINRWGYSERDWVCGKTATGAWLYRGDTWYENLSRAQIDKMLVTRGWFLL